MTGGSSVPDWVFGSGPPWSAPPEAEDLGIDPAKTGGWRTPPLGVRGASGTAAGEAAVSPWLLDLLGGVGSGPADEVEVVKALIDEVEALAAAARPDPAGAMAPI